MVHIPKSNRKKWDPKAHECIMTGFDDHTKGYRLYDAKRNIIFKSRNVSFIDENNSISKCQTKSTLNTVGKAISLDLDCIDDTYINANTSAANTPNMASPLNTKNEPNFPKQPSGTKHQFNLPSLRRSERTRHKPSKLDDFVTDIDSISSSYEYESAEVTDEEVEPKENLSGAENDFYGFSGLVAPPSHQNRHGCTKSQQMSKLGDEGCIHTGKYLQN